MSTLYVGWPTVSLRRTRDKGCPNLTSCSWWPRTARLQADNVFTTTAIFTIIINIACAIFSDNIHVRIICTSSNSTRNIFVEVDISQWHNGYTWIVVKLNNHVPWYYISWEVYVSEDKDVTTQLPFPMRDRTVPRMDPARIFSTSALQQRYTVQMSNCASRLDKMDQSTVQTFFNTLVRTNSISAAQLTGLLVLQSSGFETSPSTMALC